MEHSEPEYAARVASLLLSSFPNQAHDAKTFLKQLTLALTGRPKSDVKALVDPRHGYIAKAQFLTIAGVNEWLDKRAAPDLVAERLMQLEAKQLEDRKRPPVSAEERERAAKLWRRVRAELAAQSGRGALASSVLTPAEQARLDAAIADPDFPELERTAKQIGEIL